MPFATANAESAFLLRLENCFLFCFEGDELFSDIRLLRLEIRCVLAASQFARHFFEDVGFYGFEGGGAVCETLWSEVRFEFLQKCVALALVRAIDGDALLGIGHGGGRGAEVGAGEAAQAR
jgi:hypothetical protein